jgi:hypothetical protein
MTKNLSGFVVPAEAEILMWHMILHLKPIFSDTEQRHEADSRQ